MESRANDGASNTRGIVLSSPCISLFGVYSYLTVYINTLLPFFFYSNGLELIPFQQKCGAGNVGQNISIDTLERTIS